MSPELIIELPMPLPVVCTGSWSGSKPQWIAPQCFHTQKVVCLCQKVCSLSPSWCTSPHRPLDVQWIESAWHHLYSFGCFLRERQAGKPCMEPDCPQGTLCPSWLPCPVWVGLRCQTAWRSDSHSWIQHRPDTNVKAPWGAMPIMAVNVAWDLYVENTSLCNRREDGVWQNISVQSSTSCVSGKAENSGGRWVLTVSLGIHRRWLPSRLNRKWVQLAIILLAVVRWMSNRSARSLRGRPTDRCMRNNRNSSMGWSFRLVLGLVLGLDTVIHSGGM